MQLKKLSWLTGLALVFAGAGIPAMPAEPTSAATKAEMIMTIATLEKQPHYPNARDMRAKVLTWLTEAPDVTVNVCADLFGNFKADQPGGEAMLQQLFAQAKFILEHPDQANDELTVQLAGIEGALRTYAILKAEDPKIVFPAMEEMARLQAEQKLPEHVKKVLAKCNG
jgi:hypothetical protein